MARIRSILVLGAAIALVGALIAAPAVAAEPSAEESTAPLAKYVSTLTITRNGVTTTSKQVSFVPQATGPAGAYLYCNQTYHYSDGDGSYTIQHACGGSTGPWSYRMSAGLCSLVVGAMTEAGMSWTLNGRSQPRQAPHVTGCGYTIHGTYNPDRDYDHIAYADAFAFAVKGGHGSLQIYGSFVTVGNPCSPTSC